MLIHQFWNFWKIWSSYFDNIFYSIGSICEFSMDLNSLDSTLESCFIMSYSKIQPVKRYKPFLPENCHFLIFFEIWTKKINFFKNVRNYFKGFSTRFLVVFMIRNTSKLSIKSKKVSFWSKNPIFEAFWRNFHLNGRFRPQSDLLHGNSWSESSLRQILHLGRGLTPNLVQ